MMRNRASRRSASKAPRRENSPQGESAPATVRVLYELAPLMSPTLTLPVALLVLLSLQTSGVRRSPGAAAPLLRLGASAPDPPHRRCRTGARSGFRRRVSETCLGKTSLNPETERSKERGTGGKKGGRERRGGGRAC